MDLRLERVCGLVRVRTLPFIVPSGATESESESTAAAIRLPLARIQPGPRVARRRLSNGTLSARWMVSLHSKPPIATRHRITWGVCGRMDEHRKSMVGYNVQRLLNYANDGVQQLMSAHAPKFMSCQLGRRRRSAEIDQRRLMVAFFASIAFASIRRLFWHT